jgi:sugar/nucleoside kinase (ribokinase family)
MKVLCAGLMVCDILASPLSREVFDRDSVRVGPVSIGTGGDALNAAVNLAKLGLDVRVAGCVGEDPFGDILLREASRHGVDTTGVRRTGSCGTAVSIVLIEKTGERHFVYHGGGNDLFEASMITGGMLQGIDCLCINSLFDLPALEGSSGLAELLAKARSLGILTALDVTGNPDRKKWPALAEVLPHLDYFLPSENEAAALTGLSDPAAMAEAFLAAGCGHAVVKCGERGAYIAGRTPGGHSTVKGGCFVGSFPVKQVDATGAGDAFVAGFIYGLSRGLPPDECARYGCAAGALCVTGIGATAATPTEEGLHQFLKQQERV